MTLTQITHHDLDGYGASTVAARLAAEGGTPHAIRHVSRYGDVGPILEEEVARLRRAPGPETLLLTDLGLEEATIAGLRRFAALNRARAEDARHRLIALDHHASSLDQLRRGGFEPRPDPGEGAGGVLRVDLDAGVLVLVDEGRCATRMTYDHRALLAPGGEELKGDDDLRALVARVDAVDLWRKDDPGFADGLALDEVFWDHATGFVPPGHPWHDRFVSDLLLAAARAQRGGADPAELEGRSVDLRRGVVDALLAGEPGDDPRRTTRWRLARALARSEDLFRPLSDGTLLSFGLDAGTFQRLSDLVMAEGRARRVVNVQRAGTLSFRSVDGTALAGARLFRGGGHRDAAGGKLPSGTAHSHADALGQVEPVLNPPPPDLSKSPFAALKDWKG